MAGIPGNNFHNFNRVACVLRNSGFAVQGPHENFGGRQNLPRDIYMRADIYQVLNCDQVVFLPGWRDSKGAVLEALIASETGKELFEFVEVSNGFDLRPIDPAKCEVNFYTEATKEWKAVTQP